MKNKTVNKNGISFCGLLTITFIVLKLCNVINWSWVWILSPLWIAWTLVLVIVGIIYLIAFLRKRHF